MDLQVGAILKQLEEDGLAENTIVFFYSDHGSGIPRHKRALLDSGMRVPCSPVPQKWQHLALGKPGSTTDRLVSFVDYAPTVLNLLGQPIPKAMQGRNPFSARMPPRRAVAYTATAIAWTKCATFPVPFATADTFTSATTCRTSATTNPPPGPTTAKSATSFIAWPSAEK